jgi:hypothetical protein
MTDRAIGLLYLERLSDADLAVLLEAAGESGPIGDRVGRLRSEPQLIPSLLEQPRAYETLFGPGNDEALLFASPHLAFSILVARVWHELGDVPFVKEWVGPRRFVPVFDVMALREFAEDRMRRLFLADLLSSYTHVASGPIWVRRGRRWTRRRFSELDPLQLIRLIEWSPEADRPALYRRLGDLSLFLAGVFPDRATRGLAGAGVASLERAVGSEGLPDVSGPIELLEWLGRRSYRMVAQGAWRGPSGMGAVLEEVVEGFSQARRVLNFLTERHLFPAREGWFGPGVA